MCAYVGMVTHMKRAHFFLPEDLLKELKKLSEKTGVPAARIVRDALKKHIEQLRQSTRRDKGVEQ